MKTIVVDTNKLLAAILRPGHVRKLLFTAEAILITPIHAWDEVEEKIGEIARRKDLDPNELTEIAEEIRREVTVEVEPKEPHKTRAKKIAEAFDPDDWPFIALALEYKAPVWTNDKELIKNSLENGEYQALDTRAVGMLLEGESWEGIQGYLREKYKETDNDDNTNPQ